MGPTQVRDYCPVDETGRQLLGAANAATCGRAMNLRARAYHRVLKLARTIADLAGSERIQPAHIAMPICDRPRSSIGRDGWSRTECGICMYDSVVRHRGRDYHLHSVA